MRFFPAWKHAPHLRCGSCGIQMERAVCTEFIRVEKAQDMQGGIMSAAMDGLRLADDVMKRYHPVY